jgi:hypothetical protein
MESQQTKQHYNDTMRRKRERRVGSNNNTRGRGNVRGESNGGLSRVYLFTAPARSTTLSSLLSLLCETPHSHPVSTLSPYRSLHIQSFLAHHCGYWSPRLVDSIDFHLCPSCQSRRHHHTCCCNSIVLRLIAFDNGQEQATSWSFVASHVVLS